MIGRETDDSVTVKIGGDTNIQIVNSPMGVRSHWKRFMLFSSSSSLLLLFIGERHSKLGSSGAAWGDSVSGSIMDIITGLQRGSLG